MHGFIEFRFLGPEYGTTEAGWKGVCLEADRLGDLHLKIKDNLCNDVTTQIKSWQKESYHKVCSGFFWLLVENECLVF